MPIGRRICGGDVLGRMNTNGVSKILAGLEGCGLVRETQDFRDGANRFIKRGEQLIYAFRRH